MQNSDSHMLSQLYVENVNRPFSTFIHYYLNLPAEWLHNEKTFYKWMVCEAFKELADLGKVDFTPAVLYRFLLDATKNSGFPANLSDQLEQHGSKEVYQHFINGMNYIYMENSMGAAKSLMGELMELYPSDINDDPDVFSDML